VLAVAGRQHLERFDSEELCDLSPYSNNRRHRYFGHGQTQDEVAAKLTRVQELLASGTAKNPDGNLEMINAVLKHVLPRGFAKAGRSVPATHAVRLLGIESPEHGLAYLSKPVLHGGSVYLVGILMEGNQRVKQLFQIDLADRKVTRHGKISQPWGGPPQPGASRFAVYRRLNPLGRPVLYNDRMYCPAAHYGGILAFPIDGADPELMTPESSPGMATGEIDAIALLDDGILALSSGDLACVLWYDLKTKRWETIASSRRAEKTSLLDYPEWYTDGTCVVDPPRHRILFSLRQMRTPGSVHSGLYEFSTETHKITKLFAFPRNGPVWMQTIDRDTLWVCFPWVSDKIHRVFEFDLSTNRWQLVINNSAYPEHDIDAKVFDSDENSPVRGWKEMVVPEGLDLNRSRYSGEQLVFPPFAMVDGWLWCFKPLCRISPDGKDVQRFPELEPQAYADYFGYPGIPNTLDCLPDERRLLYGCQNGLWLMEVPPPAKRTE
jgi:hypothetical protein